MEKKIDKNFFYLSALNIIPAVWLGGGLTWGSLILVGVLVVLVLNHLMLVNMVVQLTLSMTATGADSKKALRKFLFFMISKFTMLALIVGVFYYYDQSMIPKVIILMILQLIFQVVSIKNNHLQS